MDFVLTIAMMDCQNEFGEVGIDHLLTASHFESDDDIFQMNNGCLCVSLVILGLFWSEFWSILG